MSERCRVLLFYLNLSVSEESHKSIRTGEIRLSNIRQFEAKASERRKQLKRVLVAEKKLYDGVNAKAFRCELN